MKPLDKAVLRTALEALQKEKIDGNAKPVYPSRRAADICGVSEMEIATWFDSGKLKGYRIPGSQDRRIPYDHLEKFLKDHS